MKCGFLVFALVANSLHLSSCVVSPPRVIDAWLDGATTSSIATNFCCSQRHVQKLLAVEGLGQSRLPVHPRLAVVVSREVARHGANYGVKMLLGALHAHYPGFRFPRRKVLMVMKASVIRQLSTKGVGGQSASWNVACITQTTTCTLYIWILHASFRTTGYTWVP